MADEFGGGVAVEEVVSSENNNISTDESTSSITNKETPDKTPKTPTDGEKQDNRRQPDALRKRISEIRRQADTITDPIAKKALLDDAKALNDAIGKKSGYEQVYPTVREVREVKEFMDSFGGREGITEKLATLENVQQIDEMLERGDPAVLDNLWEEAKEGITKLVPEIVTRLQKENPEAYSRMLAPHAANYVESQGFVTSLEQIYSAIQKGDNESAINTLQGMYAWLEANKSQENQTKQVDPEVERLRKELDTRTQSEQTKAVESAYTSVVSHAGPTIDKSLKPIVAKLGLSSEQYNLLREDVWNELQKQRNADATYKTVAAAKQKQGIENAVPYIKQWTENNAKSVSERVAKLRYGHQLRNNTATNVTKPPASNAPAVQWGPEPDPADIDYSQKGKMAARKAGYKDLQDMLMDGKGPLKSGGIRQWR